jgi:hypothetical protein
MKRIIVFFFSIFMLFFFASGLQAQNKSAENSKVIDAHYSSMEYIATIFCDETGWITFTCHYHAIFKHLPNGKGTQHFLEHGEGIDEYGGKWKMHGTHNDWGDADDFHKVYTRIFHGPKGAKLKVKIVIVEKDGVPMVHKFDPLCE